MGHVITLPGGKNEIIISGGECFGWTIVSVWHSDPTTATMTFVEWRATKTGEIVTLCSPSLKSIEWLIKSREGISHDESPSS